jgi:NTE family protein
MFRRFRRSDDIVGFAFSGGGSRGASQVGALKALTENAIHPQLVAGTSAGAVNAAWYALHPQRIDRLEAIWLALRTRDVFPGTPVRVLLNLARRGYVHHSADWERFLRRQIGTATFADATIPCFVTAMRLSDGQPVVFDSGELVAALMASTAIPGVFPPYEIDGEMYVDGGVLEYLPLRTLLDRGATTIWALDCSSFGHAIDPRASVVDRVNRIASYHYVLQETSLSATRGRTVHLLRPELVEFRDGRDFAYGPQLIQAGYSHAQDYVRRTLRPTESPGDLARNPHAG